MTRSRWAVLGLVVASPGLWALVLTMGWYDDFACIQWPYLPMCG